MGRARQTLIDLRACGVVLAHHVLDGCSYDRNADFGELLKLPELRRLPIDRQVHLDWLRKKGNIAAHPEDAAPNVAYDCLAQEGLKYAHGLAVWFSVERIGLRAETLPAFALPIARPFTCSGCISKARRTPNACASTSG